MTYDPAPVRPLSPALAEGMAHLDGPGGTQVPQPVIDAVAAGLRDAMSNRGGPFPSSVRSVAAVGSAREAIADLVGASPEGVVLGPNMTTVTYVLAGALARTWRAGDEVVVTRLDHDANVRPWEQVADRAGATVRWEDVVTQTFE